MPFAQPMFGDSSGARVGATFLDGSLFPGTIQGTTTTVLSADIGALPPYGLIGTTVVASFVAGQAPSNATHLLVLVSGTTTTCRGLVWTAGGACHAHAELSINILEGRFPKPSRANPHPDVQQTNSFQSAPIVLFDLIAGGLGFSEPINDGAPAPLTLTVPVLPNRKYVVLIALFQSAECQGVSGPGEAISNVMYEFPPVFFIFL